MVKFSMVKSTSNIPELAKKIVVKFKDELGHIDLRHVQFAWRFSKTSRYHGKTRLIRGEDRMFTDKRICIVLWLRSWKKHDMAWRLLLIYHELRHVLPPKKEGGDYRLIRHDVEDFADLIKKYGIRWEKASEFQRILEG